MFKRTTELALGLQQRAVFPHTLDRMIEKWGEPLRDYARCYCHYNFVDENGECFEIQMIKLTGGLSQKTLRKICHCFYIFARAEANIEFFINWIVEELELLESLVVIQDKEPIDVNEVGASSQATSFSEAC